jgi:signal peptide peptidase SppA
MTKHEISLLRQILSGQWLMEEHAAYGQLPILMQWMQGLLQVDAAEKRKDPITGEALPPIPVAVEVAENGENRYYVSYDDAPVGSVSLSHVKGTLMKDDWCGDPGTASLAKALQRADAHANIGSHILLIDSPGGTVDGTKDFADTIASLGKPVIAFVDGIAASAAYWASAAADEIMLSNDTSSVGSIGTMLAFQDYRGWYEQKGVKFHDIRADASHEKNESYYQALKGNYKPVIEQQLNPLNDIFVNAVKTFRAGVPDKALHGRMFLAADAIQLKLADSIGNFSQAVARAQALADAKTQSGKPPYSKSQSITQEQMFAKNKFPKLTALAGQQSISEEALEAANQELVAQGISGITLMADAAIEANDQEQLNLNARIMGLNNELKVAKEAREKAEAERDAWKGKAEAFGSQPGAVHSQAQAAADVQLEDDWDTKLDQLAHNVAADNSPLIPKK